MSPSQLWNVIRPATLQPPQALTCPEIPVVSLVTKKEACVQVKRKIILLELKLRKKTNQPKTPRTTKTKQTSAVLKQLIIPLRDFQGSSHMSFSGIDVSLT